MSQHLEKLLFPPEKIEVMGQHEIKAAKIKEETT